MPGNVEIKARIQDVDKVMSLAKSICKEHIALEQSDTFFKAVVTGCRLKMRFERDRTTGIKSASLIAYQRPDVTGPKFSHYVMTSVADPEDMEEVLGMSNGLLGKVEKDRDVFIVSRKGLQARVHVDDVKGLGSFIEFEVIVEKDSQMKDANEFAEYLSKHFGLSKKDHVPGAYMNLLLSADSSVKTA